MIVALNIYMLERSAIIYRRCNKATLHFVRWKMKYVMKFV